MGNDLSAIKGKRERENLTQAAIERALEKQRKFYEERLRECLLHTQSPQQEITPSTSGRLEEAAEAAAFYNNNTRNRQNLYPNLNQVIAGPHSSSASEYNYSACDAMNNVNVAANTASSSTKIQSEFLHDDVSRFTPSAPPAPTNDSRPPPNRPQSKKNKKGGKELDCPTCGNKFNFNIFQCVSGHSACCVCKLQNRRCGIPNCGKILTDMRNRTLEVYIADIMLAEQAAGNKKPQPNASDNPYKINCPNHQDGCSLRFCPNEMDKHLKECPFNEIACPLSALFGQCLWRGKINQMASHFTNFHPEHLQANIDTEMTLMNIGNNKRIVYLVIIGTFKFLVHVKVDSAAQMIYMGAQLLVLIRVLRNGLTNSTFTTKRSQGENISI